MLMVASGAMSESTSTSFWLSSRPSTLTMSFWSIRSLGTFMPMLMASPSLPSMPRMARTFSACPARTWSMTVPLRILLTRSSCSLIVLKELVEQGHPDRDAVVGLFEVLRVLGVVHLGCDLVDAWQRVHDGQVVRRRFQRFLVDLVLARNLEVLVLVGEALALDTGDVQHVEALQDGVEVGVLADVRARLVEVVADATGELEALGADEVLADVEVRQRVRERVDRPAVLQVAHDADGEVVQARVLPDGVQVEQRLRGMVARAVARVQQRNVDELAHELCRPLAGVAQDERVGVPLDDARGVGEALALLHAGRLDGPHVDDVPAQALDGRLEAHLRPGARFVEHQAEQRGRMPIPERRRVRVELGRAVEDRLDVLPRQLFCVDEMVVPH